MSRRSSYLVISFMTLLALMASMLVPARQATGQEPWPTPESEPMLEVTDVTEEIAPFVSTDVTDASAAQIEELQTRLAAAVRIALAELDSAISLRELIFDGRVLVIDLSAEARGLADEGRFDEVLKPIDNAVSAVLNQEPIDTDSSLEYEFLIEGAPLVPSEAPQASAEEFIGPAVINGKRIVINPGHGWYFDGSSWRLQRGTWWGIVEDFINADLAIQLRSKLVAVGADVRTTRELSKGAGTHASSGKPLWQVGAAAYTRQIGAPASVYAASNSGLNHDLMARPYYANWIGANATISIHNNGGRGCGTETWYDTSNAYANQSRDLAQRIQNKIIERVRGQWNVNWCNRGVKGSNGGYGEIRAVNGPAVLIELAFMDTYADNQALQNATFQNIVTQAISDAVTEYFGGVAVSCPVGSYRAEYFANTTLSGTPAFVRCEAVINANWGTGGPGGGLSADNFSVRWRGTHYFAAGTYAFVATADDGVRLSVDGYPMINGWRDQPFTQYRATRGLRTGNHTIVLEYYERTGAARAQLFWNTNLALRAPAFANSQQDTTANFVAARGNDGNTSTRWSSRQSWTLGQQWWWTDLRTRQAITEVRITWERAYAADHCIAWWSDGQSSVPSTQMRCYTISAPGRYSYAIGTQSARYVGVLMRRRAPLMSNYSLWEFGTYRWAGVLNGADDEAELLLAQDLPAPESLALPQTSAPYQVYLPLTYR